LISVLTAAILEHIAGGIVGVTGDPVVARRIGIQRSPRRLLRDAWKPLRKGLPDPQGLRIPVVAASSSQPGVFYCSTEGMVYRSEDDGLQWQKLAVQWNSKARAEHATGMAIVEEG
jgi:hypothetical protein